MDSTPGWPWCLCGNTNEKFLDFVGYEAVAGLVLGRLLMLLEYSPEDLDKMSAGQMVYADLCDPVRLFVKNEPHKESKALANRWRLISSVSLIDQLVERLLFGRQNELEISMWKDIPSKPGIGLDDDGLTAVKAELETFVKPVAADVVGWDWSMQSWQMKLEAEARILLCEAAPKAALAIRNRYRALSCSVLLTSDGQTYHQQDRGIMKSGAYVTSSTNSRVRWWVALLAGATKAITMGDDCVEEYSPQAEKTYASLGHPLKMYHVVAPGEHVEFCSHVFAERPYPVTWAKTFYRLLNQRPATHAQKEEFLGQFERDLRNSSHLAQCLSIIEAVGWPRSKLSK